MQPKEMKMTEQPDILDDEDVPDVPDTDDDDFDAGDDYPVEDDDA
jgi:hypothetical protein